VGDRPTVGLQILDLAI